MEVTEIDIEGDPVAAEFVTSLTGGNQTTMAEGETGRGGLISELHSTPSSRT